MHATSSYRASSYASAVLAGVILSVCPSLHLSDRLSHACFVTKDKTKQMHCGYFDTIRKGNHSSSLTQQRLVGDAPSV